MDYANIRVNENQKVICKSQKIDRYAVNNKQM